MKFIEELQDQAAKEVVSGEFEIFMNHMASDIAMATDAMVKMAGDELPDDPADVESLRLGVYTKFEGMFEAAMVGGFVAGAEYGRTHKEGPDGAN